jgi:hypothetical protein
MLDKMETGRGHLGGSVEDSEEKGGDSVVAIPRFLCGSLRLCRLRTEGLVPESNYWMYRSHAGVYGPSKPSSLPSIDTWLKPTALLAGLREKLRRVPWTTQPGWEVESGTLFLGSSSIRPTLLTTYKRLSRTETTHRKRTPDVCGLAWKAYVLCWSGFPLQGVHRFESLWLSDMGNRLFVAAIK